MSDPDQVYRDVETLCDAVLDAAVDSINGSLIERARDLQERCRVARGMPPLQEPPPGWGRP